MFVLKWIKRYSKYMSGFLIFKPLYLKVCLEVNGQAGSLLSVFGNPDIFMPSILMYGNCFQTAGIYISEDILL